MRLSTDSKKLGARKKALKIFLLIFVFSSGISSVAMFQYKNQIIEIIHENIVLRTHIKSLGIGGLDRNISASSITLALFNNLSKYLQTKANIENIIIDIKFEDYQKLKENRLSALTNGILQKNHLEAVNAKIQVGEKKFNAKVQLSGFYLDHVATEKWSLNIRIKNDYLDGIKVFRLNAPFTRDFQSSLLINEAMRFKHILAPRDRLYNLILNGKNLGIMHFQEKYSEQFTENANRPLGPILDFDEKTQLHRFRQKENFWKIDSNLALISSNLENILNRPDQHIDFLNEKAFADYLAITFLFKCFHGNIAINLVHYFHPIDRRLQPISSDNSCGQKNYARVLGFLPFEQEFVGKLIKIESFRELLIEKITWWNESEKASEFLNYLKKRETDLHSILSKEALFLEHFSISTDHLPSIISWLNKQKNSQNTVVEKKSLEVWRKKNHLPFPTITSSDNGFIFDVNEFSSDRYLLDQLLFDFGEHKEKINIQEFQNKEEISKSINQMIEAHSPLLVKRAHFTFYDKNNKNKYQKMGVSLLHSQKYKHPFSVSRYELLRKKFKFNARENSFSLGENQKIILDQTLIFPKGSSLTLEKGSSISFKNKSGLIIQGGLEVNGTVDAKVRLDGYQSNDWSGMLVLANGKKVTIEHLDVVGGNGKFAQYSHRGATTILNGELIIKNSNFSQNLSEDALNLVEVNGSLINVNIYDTKSDGLDVDFGDLVLSDSNFVNIGSSLGADAIDVSKTKIKINNATFENITDKAISVGEASEASISNIKINLALVGIVSKDSSIATMSNVNLEDISFADVMAYRKKKHFNGGVIKAVNLSSTLNRNIAQHGSFVSLNNAIIPTQKVDITSFYNSFMESAK